MRATRRVLDSLPARHEESGESDTALGDWYVNRLVVDRQPLLLLVSARGLLPIVTPARDVRTLPHRLAELVADRLCRLGVQDGLVSQEIGSMSPVQTAGTRDRSVVGILVEFARMLPHALEGQGSDESTLQSAEAWLARTPCRTRLAESGTVFPDQAVPELLSARWT